jgi:hypothetical protein
VALVAVVLAVNEMMQEALGNQTLVVEAVGQETLLHQLKLAVLAVQV